MQERQPAATCLPACLPPARVGMDTACLMVVKLMHIHVMPSKLHRKSTPSGDTFVPSAPCRLQECCMLAATPTLHVPVTALSAWCLQGCCIFYSGGCGVHDPAHRNMHTAACRTCLDGQGRACCPAHALPDMCCWVRVSQAGT